MSDKTSSMALYRRLLGYVKAYWPMFLLAALGNVMYSGVDAYTMALFKPLLDKGFIGRDMHFLHMLPFLVLFLFILRGIGSILGTYCIGWIGRRVVLRFRQQVFARFLVLPASFYDNTSSGQLLAKIIYNVDQVAQATGESLTTLVREGSFVIGLLAVMFYMSWRFSLLIFIVLPFVIIAIGYVSKRFRRLSRNIQTAMGQVTHVAEETVTGYREVRIYGGEDYQKSLFDKLSHYNYVQEMKVILTDALNNPVVQFLGACVLALVLYLAFRNPHQLMSPGRFVAFLSAMLALLKPVKNLTRVNNSIQRGLAAAESIFEVLDYPVEQDRGTKTIEAVKGQLSFQQVYFRYHDMGDWVLNNINLEVQAGQTVALVGRSGGGKSSLISLLARFYQPIRGCIQLDGVDIQELDLKHLRSQIALVSQHVTLFDDSLFHNIAYGKPDATEAEVIAAAKAAHAWSFIERLPEGLKTTIGENGLNLSGGQRQRIAIARAILKNAPILILDEATSALDNESERMVQKALDHLKQNRTTFVVAHRLSTIEKADCIVVMDQGKVVELGDHDGLMAQKGTYYQLQQSAAFEA